MTVHDDNKLRPECDQPRVALGAAPAETSERHAKEDNIRQLQLQIMQKEQALQAVTTRLREQDKLIRSLRQETAERGQATEKQALEKRQVTQSLSRMLSEREQKVQSLTAQLAAQKQEVQALTARLAEQAQEAQLLTAQLAEQAQNTLGLEAEKQNLEAEKQNLAQELLDIHLSQYWRCLGYYWRLRHAVRHPRWALRRAWALLTQGRPAQEPPPSISAQPAQPAPKPETLSLAEMIEQAAPPRYDVICFPIIPWGFRFQRPQQLMSQYAAAGHRVFYLAPDFRPAGPLYLLSELGPNIYEVSLRGPARNIYTERLDDKARAELFAALDALRREQIPAAAVSFVQLPFWQPLSEQLRAEFAWPIVYDCMDYHAGFSTNRPEMLEAEDRLLAAADRVIVTSPFLEEQVAPHNPHTLLVRNACDYEHFAQVVHQPRRRTARPVIGYFGAIADWFDADLVADLAARRPDWDFVLIGSTFSGDTTRLATLPNVTLPGEQPYAELPRWLKKFDVSIIPFKRLPLTEATNPVKAYELLAAGKPIVAVPIPEVVALAPLVRLAETAADFEREIAAALAEDSRQLVEQRRAFARENTWAQRFASLTPTVRDAFPLVSIIIVTYNNLELNRLCLESLYRLTNWPNFEVIVVDNASTDGTPEYLQQAEQTFPNLRVFLNQENRGFAPANNLGFYHARGDYLVLLNNDTVLTPGWLAALIRHLHANPWLGLVGPVTNAIGNEAKVRVGYEQPEQMFDWAAGYVREHDQHLAPIAMLAMFCVGMHREMLKRVGILDERFAIGMFEDDDYCHRVRLAGYDIRCAHDAFIHHWQRSAFRLLGDEEYRRIFAENLQQYQQKWGEEWRGVGQLTGPSLVRYSEQLEQVIERVEQSRGAVIFLPSIGWDIVLFQRPHHLARAFARHGYTVIFDCSNVQDAARGFTEIEPNLWLFHGPEALLYEIPDPLLWSFPYNFSTQARYPAETRTVYDWIDDLSVFPYSQRLLGANHTRALREATVVGSVARRLHTQALAARPDALYLPNGVEVEHFANNTGTVPDDPQFASLLDQGKPIAGYYGALAEWFDYELLEAVARLRPDWNFLLIGPRYDESLEGRPLLTLPNVVWLGPRPYETLPNYLHHFDVATIPFAINDITLATSPLKLYEYFAGGKPVITTPMPECQAFPEVEIARTATEFAAALDRARARGQAPEFRARLRSLARENSWAARIDAVLEHLQKSGTGEKQKRRPTGSATSAPPNEPNRAARAAGVGEAYDGRKAEPRTELNGGVLVSSPVTPSAIPAAEPPPELSGAALELAQRFQHFRTANNQHFFAALARHHSSFPTPPSLQQMYFEYAITTNERGRRVADLVSQHVSLRGKRYLDIGCAYGGFVVAFAQQGAHATGLDKSEFLLEFARHNLRDQQLDLPLLCRDATQAAALAEFHNNVDIVTCNDVIEHVVSPTALLKNVAKLLRDGGVAYFEIPNGKFPRFVLQDGHHQLFGITLLPYLEAAQYFALHAPDKVYDVYTYAELDKYTQLFAQAGLELTVLEETFQHSNLETVLADLAELRASAETALQRVPAAMRPRVAEQLEQYLKEVEAAPRATPAQVRDFMLRYGVSFWQVLGRKRS
jgi:GT2 family glycosyltransferase/2-polyprenyl-3-methyl-5-hydroxy-6-metoxy-1,4-benzoquinol methylase